MTLVEKFNSEIDNPEDWIDSYSLSARLRNWSDEDLIKYLPAHLGNREKIWYIRQKSTFTDWNSVVSSFNKKFINKIKAHQSIETLKSICQSGYNSVDEFEYALEIALQKSGITDDKHKVNWLISALSPKYKARVLESNYQEWDTIINAINLDIDTPSYNSTDIAETNSSTSKSYRLTGPGKPIKEMTDQKIGYDEMISKIEEWSINLLSKVEEVVEKKIDIAISKSMQQRYQRPPYCSICRTTGHYKSQCTKIGTTKTDEVQSKKEISTIELLPVDDTDIDTDDTPDNDVYLVQRQKAKSNNSKPYIIDNKPVRKMKPVIIKPEATITDNVVDMDMEVTPEVTIVNKKQKTIQRIIENVEPFNLQSEFNQFYPKISLPQLIAVSPTIATEFNSLSKKIKKQEVNEIRILPQKISNCRVMVTVFNKNYWAVVDSGAACSVTTPSMVEQWGIEPEGWHRQVLVTADGTKHLTEGVMNKVPITIGNHLLEAELIVMNRKGSTLILGTDWLYRHHGIIDPRSRELKIHTHSEILVIPMKILAEDTTYWPQETELYFMVKSDNGVESDNKQIEDERFIKLREQYADIFVEDIGELTQTNLTEHSIELTDYTPIKQRPYRIPYHMQEKVRNEKENTWKWSIEQENAVNLLKQSLCTAPTLAHPNWDSEFILTTDASIEGVGAILSQSSELGERPICFASKTTNKHERNYSITHLEGLAVIWGVKKFKHYLWGRHFTIRTDHKALLNLFNGKDIAGRVARWAMILRNYDYTIVHCKGKSNPADALSRLEPTTSVEEVIDVFAVTKISNETILEYLLNNRYPEQSDEVSKKKINYLSKKFKLINNKLFKLCKGVWKEVLLRNNITEKVKEIHDESHQGIENTWRRIAEKYTGNDLFKTVKKVVKECLVCQRYIGNRNRNNELQPIYVHKPFGIFGLDAVGPISPVSAQGNRYILTGIDYFTRWPVAEAVENIKSDTIINFIITHIVQYYGTPDQIITDRGSGFISEAADTVYKYLGIKHTPSTPYRPQSNGQVERLNQTLKNTLARQCKADKNNWDSYLWKSLLVIRTMRNKSTGMSPAELLYGVKLSTPALWSPPAEISDLDLAIQERIAAINTSIPELRSIGYQKSVKAKQNMKLIYDRRVRLVNFKVDEMVLKLIEHVTDKFQEVWEGPYRVLKKLNLGAYLIADSDGNRDIVNGDSLKSFFHSNRMVPEVTTQLRSKLQRFKNPVRPIWDGGSVA
ncbi:Transposon Ty3-G Gag-Pol polyprotein [Zancudomyces culisetae]|uniref:Transposon Ty3-G Gag-Pol polyprotein n=1 Tax=Zancudomyces culisetae TaxID=1213189 RepID=A0A1R1PF09_ZANCU|nr:Transposon Ty3-G Gag-Pol polyprotein [Zancudomyces culisetae]|eukprot:OMH79509.1 Transposon Ty3-G Gag-Pol polyprotein [Zancudomyces culisetae]